MKMGAVIIPTTGDAKVEYAIQSVLHQTYKNTKLYLVTDGNKYQSKVNQILEKFENNKIIPYYLPENTGHSGQNGHRIFSAFSFLVEADYIFYLDQDNFYDKEHVESCINLLEKKNLSWVYSLRNIVDHSGEFLCKDDCESLGKYTPIFDYNLVDTSCYCVRTDVARLVAPYFVGGWGHDRRLYMVLAQNFKSFECTNRYTVNYRLGGNNSLSKEFFTHYNDLVYAKYNGELPWNIMEN